jgi:hypothetical protein
MDQHPKRLFWSSSEGPRTKPAAVKSQQLPDDVGRETLVILTTARPRPRKPERTKPPVFRSLGSKTLGPQLDAGRTRTMKSFCRASGSRCFMTCGDHFASPHLGALCGVQGSFKPLTKTAALSWHLAGARDEFHMKRRGRRQPTCQKLHPKMAPVWDKSRGHHRHTLTARKIRASALRRRPKSRRGTVGH